MRAVTFMVKTGHSFRAPIAGRDGVEWSGATFYPGNHRASPLRPLASAQLLVVLAGWRGAGWWRAGAVSHNPLVMVVENLVATRPTWRWCCCCCAPARERKAAARRTCTAAGARARLLHPAVLRGANIDHSLAGERIWRRCAKVVGEKLNLIVISILFLYCLLLAGCHSYHRRHGGRSSSNHHYAITVLIAGCGRHARAGIRPVDPLPRAAVAKERSGFLSSVCRCLYMAASGGGGRSVLFAPLPLIQDHRSTDARPPATLIKDKNARKED